MLENADVLACDALLQHRTGVELRDKFCILPRDRLADAHVGAVQVIPGGFVHDPCLRQPVDLLEGTHRTLGLRVICPRDLHRQHRFIIRADHRKRVLQPAHLLRYQIRRERLLELRGEFLPRDSFGIELCKALDAGIDVGDAVPCRLIDRPGHRQVEYLLEYPHRLLRGSIEIPRSTGDLGDRRVIPGNAVELDLDGLHGLPLRARGKGLPGEG